MNTRLVRLAPLAGIAFAVLTVLGNGSIGKFPDGDTPVAKLIPFYAAHHGGIARGGLLLYWAALFLAVFAAAVWVRIRSIALHPLISGTALLGAAVTVASQLDGAGIYSTLGFIGSKHSVTPAALQAWHINGAGGGLVSGDGGLAILLLAVAAAGIAGRAFPRWLAWTALPLGLLQLTPIGYQAEVVFWLWAAIAGAYMAVRPAAAQAPDPRRTAAQFAASTRTA